MLLARDADLKEDESHLHVEDHNQDNEQPNQIYQIYQLLVDLVKLLTENHDLIFVLC